MDFAESFLNSLGFETIEMLLSFVVIKIAQIILVIICWRVAGGVLRGIVKKIIAVRSMQKRKAQTMEQLAENIIKYGVTFGMACHILTLFGVSIAAILAVAGIGSVAIGFGTQTMVKDIMTGVLIMLEDQFGVGDTVTINGMTGKVEALGVRTTRIRGENNDLYILPNSAIAAVTNKSK